MGDAREASTATDRDVVDILQQQHAEIRKRFDTVNAAQGAPKKKAFDELRALLAVHETAEEMIVRPVAATTAGKDEAQARNAEEKEANKVLAGLEKMEIDSDEFRREFAEFEASVLEHAAHEENEEFPAIRAGRSQDDLVRMGRRLQLVEELAPTHPHPSTAGAPAAQWMVGPFASMVDRVRDTLGR
ncbi:hemerythrin domain-containing protein [Streptomyces sp. RY43-2]|uniref:Hemerythrin domain-containing protein n=1 Tax=Streptomyces macrolidinus TaxID=2952607 RepID=A0ABT0ZIZ0_9ACTN|nr:hemerythrin domain-containing protein [Streptomyces macrolidinus]MCN9243510.1 hemerythrin domain-containing protein [Streptomyces macrolidinus]